MAKTDTTPPSAARQALQSVRPWFLVAGGFSFVMNLLVMVSPLYSYQLFDRVLGSAHIETLVFLTLIAAFAFIILGWIDGLRSALLARIGTRFERKLASTLVETGVNGAVLGAPVGGQALRDLSQIRAFIGGPSIGPLFDAPWAPVFIIVMFLLHWALGVTALVSAFILFGLALANEKMLRGPTTDANKLQVIAQRQAEGAIRSAETVRAMGMLPALLGRWRKDAEAALQGQEKSSDLSSIIGGSSKFVRIFVQSFVMGVGAYLLLHGELTSGGMIAGSMLLSRALAPVEQAISSWRQFISARQSYESIEKILTALPKRKDGLTLPPPSGKVQIDKLVFVAPGSKAPIIKRVSFEIANGEVLGMVGPSASGKSTLCRLLCGIYPPTDGAVRLDGADLGQWSPETLGPHLGYLPQVVDIFPGTVAENIARMGKVDSDQVVAAAELAGVHDMIVRLPQGYDTPIGDGGVPLSGGQRQRVGLARAVFGQPKLVVLDEPNSNLDADGEAALMGTIAGLKAKGTTVIIVAHRPQILADADRLLVMRDGEIALLGPRAEVLARIAGPRAAETTPAPKGTENVAHASGAWTATAASRPQQPTPARSAG
ncbi:MAG: type I secretion system permease/ATPase [Inquilinus limosus]|uniref:Type I secretion system permease/ATPase n=1 Tax=Inquilinus limosus TaxID=171674 RepID=A0A952KEP0_9PROT|nr:type I secretion system permease/ATPase [Inquilinus limosus]